MTGFQKPLDNIRPFPAIRKGSFNTDQTAASTVIGNILMVAITLLIAGVVAMQAINIMQSVNLPRTMDEIFGNDHKREYIIDYTVEYEDSNLTITILSISEPIEIPRVNYELYNITLSQNDEVGYLVDIEGSNDTIVRFFDVDQDGHFSKGDMVVIHFEDDDPDNEYILKFRHNKRPYRAYEITIKESDFQDI